MMSDPNSAQRGVSVLISHSVRPDSIAIYERWLADIINVAARFSGHQGVNILKPSHGHHQYEIALRFSSQQDAERWLSSAERRQLITQVETHLVLPESVDITTGIDNWFQPLNKQPVRWKQWLLTTCVIWVLTLLVPPLLAYLFDLLPLLGVWGIRHGITAAVIVGLVIYVVMPRLARYLARWLFA